VTFHDEKNNKFFVGNGFLVKHRGSTYAVTVKHALLELKKPSMNSVNIAEHVNRWQIHPNMQADQSVVLGKLLNHDNSEKLDMAILQKDWLVFEIENNNSDLTVLTLRDSALEKGETLTAYGCSYANKPTCQQDSYAGTFIKMDGANLRMSLKDMNPSALRGLSGSPVLDANGQVVGIVSNIMPSESGEGLDFTPANLNYLRDIIKPL